MKVSTSLFTIWFNKTMTKWHWHVENDDGEIVADGSADDYDIATKRALYYYDEAIRKASGTI